MELRVFLLLKSVLSLVRYATPMRLEETMSSWMHVSVERERQAALIGAGVPSCWRADHSVPLFTLSSTGMRLRC